MSRTWKNSKNVEKPVRNRQKIEIRQRGRKPEKSSNMSKNR